MMECLIALAGRGPAAGLHLSEHRKASICVHVEPCRGADDAFWPLLGHCVGHLAGHWIPAVTGLESAQPSSDDLKAFGAAFGTSSSAPMFHIVGITPETTSSETVLAPEMTLRKFKIGRQDLAECWQRFNDNNSEEQVSVDLVSLGSPHLSCREIRKLAQLCRGKTKHLNMNVTVTSGRTQYSLAKQAGAIAELEGFGVQFLTDTCWCFIEEPLIPTSQGSS